MLARLEAELRAPGCSAGLLAATATTTRLYLARGWWPDGPARHGRWIVGQPMRRTLAAAPFEGAAASGGDISTKASRACCVAALAGRARRP